MAQQKTKKCTNCKGTGKVNIDKMDAHGGSTCPSCEGTGVILFDEQYDDMRTYFISDEEYFKSKEEDDDR